MVLAAARAAANGKCLEEVRRNALRLQPLVNVVAMLDTLHYLALGGRVPKVAAWASSLLQVKPILEIGHGGVHLQSSEDQKKGYGAIEGNRSAPSTGWPAPYSDPAGTCFG